MQPEQMFQLQTLWIENDEQRVAALDKWKAWRHEHPASESSADRAGEVQSQPVRTSDESGHWQSIDFPRGGRSSRR
jgi:hypothetical protein